MILVFITLHKKEMAKEIGHELLKRRLIACYNLVPIESAYWWKGKIEEENETLMVLKTQKENFEKIESYVNEKSGYEVPEVVAIEPSEVNQPYLDWVLKETS